MSPSGRRHGIAALCFALAALLAALPVWPSAAGYRPTNGDDVSSYVGIWFSEGVSPETRRLLVDDLDWLARDARPEFRQAVAATLGSSTTDGAMLAYELMRRMPVVVTYDACLDDGIGVSTIWRDDDKWTFRPFEPAALPEKPILCPSALPEKGDGVFWNGAAAIQKLLKLTSPVYGSGDLALSGMPKNWQALAIRIGPVAYEVRGSEANVVFIAPGLAELDRRDRLVLLATELRQAEQERPATAQDATAAADWRRDFAGGHAKALVETTFACGERIECAGDPIPSAVADITRGPSNVPVDQRKKCNIVLANDEWRAWTEGGTERFLIMSNSVPRVTFQYRGRRYGLGIQLYAVNAVNVGKGFEFAVGVKSPRDSPLSGLGLDVLQREIAPMLFARSKDAKLEIEVDGNLEYSKALGTDALQDLPNLFEYAQLGDEMTLRIGFVGGEAVWTLRSKDLVDADALAVRMMNLEHKQCADDATLASLDSPELVGAMAWEHGMAILDALSGRTR